MVAGASVILSDPQTGDAVASGTTGSDGTLELDGLPVGTYNVPCRPKDTMPTRARSPSRPA